ncbi:pyrexia [Carabus blaptoides fortunei]
MGGMGKTQLARKFASVNADVYRDRYWLNAETKEQLLKSFDRLAIKVNVKANTDIDTVRDTYHSFTEGATLLIFDNVEHVNNVYEYLPTRIQLEDITLHVLITSRWTEWTCDPLVNCYQLQPLDISVSLQLFQKKISETAMEAVLKQSKNQIQIAMKELDLLCCAVKNGHLNMTQLLYKYGADINQLCGGGRWAQPPLYHALHDRNVEIATWLLENGATPTVRDGVVSRSACAEAVSFILRRNNDLINNVNKCGKTALHVIPYEDGPNGPYIDDERIVSTIRVLVESGADLTKVDEWGNTVLHLAARHACAESLTLFLQLNNDLINIVNRDGETAFDVIPYDNPFMNNERIDSTIRVLVESGADLTKVDTWGNTVLHVAARSACAESLTLILQRNKDLIDIKNEDGKTALHVLGNNCNIYISKKIFAAVKKTARVLIMNGMSLDTRDNNGCTPLDTVEPEFKNILRQVADECNNQLLVRPVKRQMTSNFVACSYRSVALKKPKESNLERLGDLAAQFKSQNERPGGRETLALKCPLWFVLCVRLHHSARNTCSPKPIHQFAAARSR